MNQDHGLLNSLILILLLGALVFGGILAFIMLGGTLDY